MMEPEEGYELYENPVVGEVEPAVDEAVEPVAENEPEAPDVEEESEPEEDEDKPKKKSGSQRAREKAMRLEIENQMLRDQLEAKKPTETKPAEGKPKQDDYETHEDWVEALTDWKFEQRIAEQKQKQEAEKIQTVWEKKVEAGREKYEDFDEALQNADAPSTLLAKRITSEKTPVEVVYHLATHPREYKAINAMTDPDDVADAMAELKARLSAPKESVRAKQTTKAPAPIAPVRGSAVAVQDHDGYEAY